jgi:coiled-coil domain-containing protein 39
VSALQNELFQATQKLEGIQQQTQWRKDEYEQWALAEKQKAEDTLTLMKYKRADEQKVGYSARVYCRGNLTPCRSAS